jgi:hypothetical protein
LTQQTRASGPADSEVDLLGVVSLLSQFCFEGAIEDGGKQGVQLAGSACHAAR